jgi:alkaline phosphatase
MNNKQSAALIMVMGISALPAWSQARNVILFTADGVGVTSLNAASIFGYGKPRALYVQSMPYLALTDTSSAKEWFSDEAAVSTAWATGVRTGNGIRSESASAERGIREGEKLKTILEYAEEHGLSTGIVTDNDESSVAAAAVSAFYVHSHMPEASTAGDTFLQLLAMKHGPDVVIGPGRKVIVGQVAKSGRDLQADIRAKGYSFVDSVDAISKLNPSTKRIIALTDNKEYAGAFDAKDPFDLDHAIEQAVAVLRRNPKGFILIANSVCHTLFAEKTLPLIVTYDNTIRRISEQNKQDTLVLFAGSRGQNMRIIGENLDVTLRAADREKIIFATVNQGRHTAEEVPVLATGPGSDRVNGYVPNTEVFHYMMAGLGWKP